VNEKPAATEEIRSRLRSEHERRIPEPSMPLLSWKDVIYAGRKRASVRKPHGRRVIHKARRA